MLSLSRECFAGVHSSEDNMAGISWLVMIPVFSIWYLQLLCLLYLNVWIFQFNYNVVRPKGDSELDNVVIEMWCKLKTAPFWYRLSLVQLQLRTKWKWRPAPSIKDLQNTKVVAAPHVMEGFKIFHCISSCWGMNLH